MKAWELLRTKKQWCQGTSARTETGGTTNSQNPDAASWCILGAISKCYGHDQDYEAQTFLFRRKSRIKSMSIWNDNPQRKFSEVKALLKKLDI